MSCYSSPCFCFTTLAVFGCCGVGLAGMFGKISWAVAHGNDNSSYHVDDLNFGLLKFSGMNGGDWIAYSDCDHWDGDVADMCDQCHLWGRVALGATSIAALLAVVGLLQLACGTGRFSLTMGLTGAMAMIALATWTRCFVQIVFMLQNHNDYDMVTFQAGGSAVVIGMLLAWVVACCARRHLEQPPVTIISQTVYHEPLHLTYTVSELAHQRENQFTPPVYATVGTASAPPISSDWQLYKTADGTPYYYNPSSQQSSWDLPTNPNH
eukprot:TRINITY_DN23697_c0_g1_i3.p1 TRINITY_DN23697_c0_g1~~TRINITY_DN23697_c0_g1_i3.p1  ORF type:complete len:266 (-),score=46.47 TRINITY_DN23697_c0_g1_i3:270-1067(-)